MNATNPDVLAARATLLALRATLPRVRKVALGGVVMLPSLIPLAIDDAVQTLASVPKTAPLICSGWIVDGFLMVWHQHSKELAAAMQMADQVPEHPPLRFLEAHVGKNTDELLVELRARPRFLRRESLLMTVRDFRKWTEEYMVLGCTLVADFADRKARANGAIVVAELTGSGFRFSWSRGGDDRDRSRGSITA